MTKSEHHQLNNYNHGRDEQGLGSHGPYAGSTLAEETDTRTRVVARKYQKWPNREAALEASRGRIEPLSQLERNFDPFRWNKFFEGYGSGSRRKTE